MAPGDHDFDVALLVGEMRNAVKSFDKRLDRWEEKGLPLCEVRGAEIRALAEVCKKGGVGNGNGGIGGASLLSWRGIKSQGPAAIIVAVGVFALLLLTAIGRFQNATIAARLQPMEAVYEQLNLALEGQTNVTLRLPPRNPREARATASGRKEGST